MTTRVLIIDDEEEHLQRARSSLEVHGDAVMLRGAINFDEAHTHLTGEEPFIPDFVIMDIDGLDGSREVFLQELSKLAFDTEWNEPARANPQFLIDTFYGGSRKIVIETVENLADWGFSVEVFNKMAVHDRRKTPYMHIAETLARASDLNGQAAYLSPHIFIIDDAERTYSALTSYIDRLPAGTILNNLQSFDAAARRLDSMDLPPGRIVMDMECPGNRQAFLKKLHAKADSAAGGKAAIYPELIYHSGATIEYIAHAAFTLQQTTPFRLQAMVKGGDQLARYLMGENMPNGLLEQRVRIAKAFPKISFASAANMAREKSWYPESIIYGLPPEQLLAACDPVVEATPEQQQNALNFEAGVGAPITGRLVFSLERAYDLRRLGVTQKLIVATSGHGSSQDVMRHAALINGIINIGEIPAHFTNVVRSAGTPALSSSFQHAARNGISMKNGLLTRQGVTFRENDIVTIDPATQTLYPGQPAQIYDMPADDLENIAAKVHRHADEYNIRMPTFWSQVDTSRDMESMNDHIGLSRMENFVLHGDALDILHAYLFNPESSNRNALKDFFRKYIAGLFSGRESLLDHRKRPPTIRLFDIKPNEIFIHEAQSEALKTQYGLDDLRGAKFFAALPDFYRLQFEAIVEALTLTERQALNIIVPMVEDVEQFRAIHAMADEFRANRPYLHLLPMIETQRGIESLPALLKFMTYNDVLMVGTSDLMSDIMGDVDREDTAGITAWMARQPFESGGHPFRSITPDLKNALTTIRETLDAEHKHVNLRVCGVQAQHIGALYDLAAIGVDEVCVPATTKCLQVLPAAAMLEKIQRTTLPSGKALSAQEREMRRLKSTP